MRTRSQPVSPGGLVSLDDMPRRRRATRSASAQPQETDGAQSAQESQPSEPEPARPTQKTRAGKGPRRKQRATRAAGDEAAATTTTANAGIENPEWNDDVAEANPEYEKIKNEKVGNIVISSSPILSAIFKKNREDHFPFFRPGQQRGIFVSPSEWLIQATQDMAAMNAAALAQAESAETQDSTATASNDSADSHNSTQSRAVEYPVTDDETDDDTSLPAVLSIEAIDAEPMGGPVPEESKLCRSLRLWHAPPRPGYWTMAHRMMLRIAEQATAIGDDIVIRFITWVLLLDEYYEGPIVALNTGPPDSTLLDIERTPQDTTLLGLTFGPGGKHSWLFRSRRSGPHDARRRTSRHTHTRFTDGTPTDEWSIKHFVSPKDATSIRRKRSSYLDIARRRRSEAGGRVEKTLYRLDNLLAQNEVDDEAPASNDIQTIATDVATPAIANPATPERAPPSTPMTAPAAGFDASPSWSRWIFNSVSRRWTSIRDRFGPHPAPPTPEAQPAPEMTAPTTPLAQEPQEAQDTAENTAQNAAQAAPRVEAPRLAQGVPSARRASFTYRSSIARTPRAARAARSSRSARPTEPLARTGATIQSVRTRRRVSSAPKLKYEYGTTSTFSKELLDHYYGEVIDVRRLKTGSHPETIQTYQTSQTSQAPQASEPVQVSQTASTVPSSATHSGPQALQTPESTAIDATTSRKRKRSKSPDVIPNPPGCSYGFDPDYFIIDSDDEDEAERDRARRAAAAAVEAEKSAKQFAEQNDEQSDDPENPPPAAKKARVDEPTPQRRRQGISRQTRSTASVITPAQTTANATPNVPLSSVSPSKRPGFIPNSRHTYQSPELSTIDSSGLFSDSVEPSEPQAQATQPQVEVSQDQAQTSQDQEQASQVLVQVSQPQASEPETPGDASQEPGMSDRRFIMFPKREKRRRKRKWKRVQRPEDAALERDAKRSMLNRSTSEDSVMSDSDEWSDSDAMSDLCATPDPGEVLDESDLIY